MDRERYRLDDLLVDVPAASVRRGEHEIVLPALSFELLVALVRASPRVLGTEELIEQVWGGVAVADETLTQRVALLRRALGDDAKNPRYVRSLRGRGYALVPAPAAVPVAIEVAPKPLPRRRRLRRRLAAAAILAVVALAVALLSLGGQSGQADPSSQPDPEGAKARSAPSTTDELVARADEYLTRHREGDTQLAIALYGRALEAQPEHLGALVGSSLGLSQGVTKFNRSTEGLERALALADRGIALAPDAGAAHYARASALDASGRISEALRSYQRAAALDPDHPRALASAGYLLAVRGELAAALETNLRVASAGDPQGQVQYLDVQIGSTLAALGFEPAAAVWLEKAIELRPDNVFAGSTFAALRLRQGRFADAELLAHDALRQGIRNPDLPMILGHVALLQGDTAAAELWYREALAVNPGRSYAASRLLILRRQAGGRSPELTREYELAAQALRDDRAAGDEWPGTALDEMLLRAAFGDYDRALTALDEAIRLGYRDADWLLLDPMLAELRRQPAFLARVERMRLAVAGEREKVVRAAWLPRNLLQPVAS